MPLYSYRCSCGHEFQKARKIPERKAPCEEPCPECGAGEIVFVVKPAKFAYTGVGTNNHDNGFNDMLKEMRKKLPNGKIPLDDSIK